MKNNYLIIANPSSGTLQAKQIVPIVQQELSDHNTKIIFTEYSGHATKIAQDFSEGDYRGIIVIGGDGTYNEVINGLLKRKDQQLPILGFVPGGSGNSLIHHLNCLELKQALSPIIKQKTRFIDLMKLKFETHEEFAFNIIGWGMAVDILKLSEKLRWLGPARYTIASLISILKFKKRFAKLSLDGVEYKDDFLFFLIANTIYTGKGMMAAPKAKLNDGLLDVIIISKEISRLQLMKLLSQIFTGKHIHSKYVKYHQVKEICLTPDYNEILNIDGELKGTTPLFIEVNSKKLCIYN